MWQNFPQASTGLRERRQVLRPPFVAANAGISSLAAGLGGKRLSPAFAGTNVVSEPYSCNCLLRISISSASAMSLPTRPSILRTACSTVV